MFIPTISWFLCMAEEEAVMSLFELIYNEFYKPQDEEREALRNSLPNKAVLKDKGRIVLNITLGSEGVKETERILSEITRLTGFVVGVEDQPDEEASEEERDLFFSRPRLNLSDKSDREYDGTTGKEIPSASRELQGIELASVSLNGLMKLVSLGFNPTSTFINRVERVKSGPDGQVHGTSSVLVLRIVLWDEVVCPVADEGIEAAEMATQMLEWLTKNYAAQVVRTFVNPPLRQGKGVSSNTHDIALEIRALKPLLDKVGEVRQVYLQPKDRSSLEEREKGPFVPKYKLVIDQEDNLRIVSSDQQEE